ncbi:hypothetical protein DVH24_015979 [Malus domestica]|uniref:Uncharacterized protein n=1 Tax=Malus domestica TaxID=3750 RepID=A0A498JJU1_MALDO|nr:hypothetical protein DVH24_015979 [Malus domestica]
MLVQESRGEKACTSAHGAVAAAAAPERCSKTISGSTKDIALSSDSERLTVVITSGSQRGGGEKACTKVTTAAPEKCSKKFSALTNDTTLLSDPERLDVAIISGLQTGWRD